MSLPETFCHRSSCDVQGRAQGRRRTCTWCGGRTSTRWTVYYATPHLPGGRYSPEAPASIVPARPSQAAAQRIADAHEGYVVRSTSTPYPPDEEEAI